jgi:hypothetical protein
MSDDAPTMEEIKTVFDELAKDQVDNEKRGTGKPYLTVEQMGEGCATLLKVPELS